MVTVSDRRFYEKHCFCQQEAAPEGINQSSSYDANFGRPFLDSSVYNVLRIGNPLLEIGHCNDIALTRM